MPCLHLLFAFNCCLSSLFTLKFKNKVCLLKCELLTCLYLVYFSFAFVYFLRSLFVDILFVYLNRNIKIIYIYLATLVYIFVYLLIALFACCLLAWKRTRLTYTLFAAFVYMIVYLFSLNGTYLTCLHLQLTLSCLPACLHCS